LDLRGRKWREAGRLCNEDPHNLYALPNIIWRMKWVGHVACMER